jgi:integrase
MNGATSIVPKGLADTRRARPAAEITSHDLYHVVEKAKAYGVLGVPARTEQSESRARHLHSCLSAMFGWALKRRRIEHNPMTSVHKPQAGRARDRVLNGSEIVKVWNACDGVFGDVVKLLILTEARLREISDMRWDEIDGDIFLLPSNRSKNHRAHTVPLSIQAREILDRQLRTGPYVFSLQGWGRSSAGAGSRNDWTQLFRSTLAVCARPDLSEWRSARPTSHRRSGRVRREDDKGRAVRAHQ